MIFADFGEVVPGFHALGNRHTPSYLLEAPRPVLFEAGMAFLGELYVEHARRVLGERQPEFLLFTHAHFDHCGSAGILQRAFPGLRIGASPEAAEILARPRAVELIGSLSQSAREIGPSIDVPEPSAEPFLPFEVDLVLKDGDELDLGGGLTVQVLATPGHTRDFLSYYVPQRRLLVASEAGGCADRHGNLSVEFVASYDAYLSSLRRLATLDVGVLCQGHEQIYLEEDARSFLERSLVATERYRARVEELLTEERGDVERVVTRLRAEQYDDIPQPKQPLSAYLLNSEARVRWLAARRDT